MRRFVMASGAMLLLAFAATSLMLLMLAACGGGRGAALPVQPVQQPQVEEGSGTDSDTAEQPEAEDGIDSETGSESEPGVGSDIPIIPPWDWEIPPGYPTWTDPRTGEVHVFYDPATLRYTEVIFKPDEWWIEEDYPIDENTPSWKIYEDAAVEELRSRGYNLFPQYDAMLIVPHWYKVILPEGMTFFDVEYVWAEEFPCIDRVTPAIYIWLD